MSLLKYISIIYTLVFVVGCSSVGVKDKVSANVESTVIDVPTQAAKDFKIAIELMNNAKLNEAEIVLMKMTEDYPQLSGPFANIGVIYSRQKKWVEAEVALQKAISKNKNNIKALNQLAFVLRNQGKFSEAEASYLKAIEISPNDALTYLNLGVLYDIYMGKLASASTYYQLYQSQQSEPDNKVAGWLVDINRRAGIKTQIAGEGN